MPPDPKKIGGVHHQQPGSFPLTDGPPSQTALLDPVSPRPEFPLPSRTIDPNNLKRLVYGYSNPLEPYHNLSEWIRAVRNPSSQGEIKFNLEWHPNDYSIFQRESAAPIEITTQRKKGEPSTEKFKLTVFPDNKVVSSLSPTFHDLSSSELAHYSSLNQFFEDHLKRIIQGENLHRRLRTSLNALQGRYTPETQSAWYDNFAVRGDKVYSFRIQNLLGIQEISQNPQLDQISIYQTNGASRTLLATLSATGEINYQPEQMMRQPLSHDQLSLVEQVTTDLETARKNPENYQDRLHRTLQGLGVSELNPPTIQRSINIPSDFGAGHHNWGLGFEFRSGWDLALRNLPFQNFSWENPQQSGEMQRLSIPWRLRAAMWKEMALWSGKTAKYWISGELRSPKPISDRLRLQLFPEGGGQVTIYRDGKLHDIILKEKTNPTWKASQEIRQMTREGLKFHSPLEAIQGAVARHGANGSGLNLKVQEAPTINLDLLNTQLIQNVESAWKIIQKQLPIEVDPRIESGSRNHWADKILPTPGEIDHIKVDFRESQPSLHLELNHQDLSLGNKEVRRVEVIMKRGENLHARVFEDGILRPDLTRDVIYKSLQLAQEGSIQRSPLTLAAQAIPRAYLYYKTSGATYGLSYFGALPLIYGYEHLLYNSLEKKILGTPTPRLSLSYFYRDFMVPFMTVATAAGASGVFIDGIYNLRPGLGKTWNTWRGTEATLTQAHRLHRPNFFNPSPIVRPIGESLLFKGFLQRAIPLFAGLTALEYMRHGKFFTPTFWKDLRDVGLVSLGSSAVVHGVYHSKTLAGFALRHGLIEAVGGNSSAARYALKFKGGVAVALVELAALGVLHAHSKKALMAEIHQSLKARLGQNINLRNELIFRISQGENVSLRQLVKTDFAVMESQASYRWFLEQMKWVEGGATFLPLGNENDFEIEKKNFQQRSAELNQLPYSLDKSIAQTNLQIDHYQKTDFYRNRLRRMDNDIEAAHQKLGIERKESVHLPDDLKSFVKSKLATDPKAIGSTFTEKEIERKLLAAYRGYTEEQKENLRRKKYQDLAKKEVEIRNKYLSDSAQGKLHAEKIVSNVADFDKQMALYYRVSNEKLAQAISTFMNAPQNNEPTYRQLRPSKIRSGGISL